MTLERFGDQYLELDHKHYELKKKYKKLENKVKALETVAEAAKRAVQDMRKAGGLINWGDAGRNLMQVVENWKKLNEAALLFVEALEIVIRRGYIPRAEEQSLIQAAKAYRQAQEQSERREALEADQIYQPGKKVEPDPWLGDWREMGGRRRKVKVIKEIDDEQVRVKLPNSERGTLYKIWLQENCEKVEG